MTERGFVEESFPHRRNLPNNQRSRSRSMPISCVTPQVLIGPIMLWSFTTRDVIKGCFGSGSHITGCATQDLVQPVRALRNFSFRNTSMGSMNAAVTLRWAIRGVYRLLPPGRSTVTM